MDNNTAVNGTADAFAASIGGTILSTGFLFFNAIVPIYFGSLRSLKRNMIGYSSEEEIITTKDAMQFPFYASGALFTLYIVFKFCPRYIINAIILALFTFSGVMCVARLLISLLRPHIPKLVTNYHFSLSFVQREEPKDEKTEGKLVDKNTWEFQVIDFPAMAISGLLGLGYAASKHWAINNVFAFGFSLTALECLHLNKFKNGFIMLGGLFFYDIFWVFFTDVMVSVAKNFDAPIKVVFPKDIIADGFNTEKLSMLGLGDIVIPGVFVAMLLRFDQKLNRKTRFYFFTGLFAYILGLICTFVAMLWFKHAQPALLYLSPSCTGLPALAALAKGDFSAMIDYSDCDEEETKSAKAEGKEAEKPVTRSSKKVN